jgi:hypothetical protein
MEEGEDHNLLQFVAIGFLVVFFIFIYLKFIFF